MLLWAIVRLPGLALAIYLLRSPIVSVIESQFDILAITRFVIDVLSTPRHSPSVGCGHLCYLAVRRSRGEMLSSSDGVHHCVAWRGRRCRTLLRGRGPIAAARLRRVADSCPEPHAQPVF